MSPRPDDDQLAALTEREREEVATDEGASGGAAGMTPTEQATVRAHLDLAWNARGA